MNNENLAVPELATVDIQGHTRAAFIVRGAMAAGAVYGLGAVSPFVGQALGQGGGDVDILNFALTLEYLENAFYTQAVKKAGLSGKTLDLAKQLRDDEAQHVSALTAAIKQLGGKPVKAPGVDFGAAFKNKDTFLKTANVFEDTGVSAYNGAAPAIKSTAILGAAGSIVQVEARHASLIRLERNRPPAPLAFDKASSKKQVLTAVTPFIKG